MFAGLLAPRDRGGHKGSYGHALIVAGGHGKTGAAAMAGMGALRAGAGLVTVASEEAALPAISAHAAELMTASLTAHLRELVDGKTVLAIGPGLGRNDATDRLVQEALRFDLAVVIDADALMPGIAGASGKTRVLTPHPGEMSRLTGKSTADVQKNRLETAREFAARQQVTLVLKGERSLIAFADGRVWINPTGTPAMGTGGTGDVLTGMIAGFLAQFPKQPDEAVAAAVYLHGRAGELGAAALGEKSLVATDLLTYLPGAIREAAEDCARLSHGV
jgi:NAD(P)H-hydrate epimerase